MNMRKKGFGILLSTISLLSFSLLLTNKQINKVEAYDGLSSPDIVANLHTSEAVVLTKDSEQTSINVSEMMPISVENETDYFTFGDSDNFGMISEKVGNKNYRVVLLPVSFSIHLVAKQTVTFSEIEFQITAYKTLAGGSAACVVELFSEMPSVINGYANESLSEHGLARTYSTGTGKSNKTYLYGEYTFANNNDAEADICLPETFYVAVICRWASSYDHLGVGLVGVEKKYCTDNRGIDDKEIKVEFDNENTVYYRQSGSNLDTLNYEDMSPVEFNDGENEIFDSSTSSRFAVFKEKSMNKFFNVILIPFRFSVSLDAYQMVTVSQFDVELTIRKIAGGGTAYAFTEVFSDRPDVITTRSNATSSPSYSVGRIGVSATSSNVSKIHDRVATNCSIDGYSFTNDSSETKDVYTSNYYYIAICGNYASTYDHIVEATMNVVPAQGDDVVSYTRNVVKNGTNCTISGGNTANFQSQYIATVVPNEHYSIPKNVQILMGEEPLTLNTQYTYNSATGQIVIFSNVVTDDITINAVATAITYTVSYSANGGSGSTSSNSGTYYEVIILRDCGFSLKYHSFLCWNTSELGNEMSYNAGEDFILTDDIVLYAIWYQTDSDIVDQFVGIDLHFEKIPASNKADTGMCRGEEGYYKTAKEAYLNLTSDQKELFATSNSYEQARARLEAWAIANGETFNYSTYQFEQNARITNIVNGTNVNLIIIVLCFSSITLISICVYRKKQFKNK